MFEINKNVIYDKFLIIEGFSYRGKLMTEKGYRERAIECYDRIQKEMDELGILLKKKIDESDSPKKKNNR